MIAQLSLLIDKYLMQDERLILSIEGPAAAGKSSLAAALRAHYNASVVHMDHFFLPLELRSAKRLAEAGGNVHYERFSEEVIQLLNQRQAKDRVLRYKVFDCSIMDYGAEQKLALTPLLIVEGVYSQHPILGEYADLKVFIDIDDKSQDERIKLRESPEQQRRYFNEWIPMEKRYFAKFGIKEKADIII